jgi:SagB-type dehydrogenase family enzyme
MPLQDPSRRSIVALLAGLLVTALSALALGVAEVFRPGGGDGPQIVETVSLPDPTTDGDMPLETALAARRSRRAYGDTPLDRAELGQLLWAMQGITERPTGHRTAPSAGALYPLELYVVVGSPGVEGMAGGVYHYRPARHDLERIDVETADLQSRLRDAAVGQATVEAAALDIVVTAVDDRTAQKYGERGVGRYVPMEAGHAGQNLYLQAETLGLATVAIGALDTDAVREILGAPASQRPLYVFPVGRRV